VRDRLLVCSLACLAFGAVAIVPASGAFAQSGTTPPDSVGIRLIAPPNASPNEPLASPYVVDRLAPGSTLTRRFEVDNASNSSVAVSVYAAAADIERGSFAFAAGHGQNQLSSWTSVRSGVLLVAAGRVIADSLTIRVPVTASSGEQYAVVWAQVSTTPTSASGGITLVNRVGIRIYLSVGSGGAPAPAFALSRVTAARSASGRPLIAATVHNTGQSTLDLHGSLNLSRGPGGLSAGPFPATVGSILAPGLSERVTVELASGLPRGPWRAALELTSGSLRKSTAATITFPLTPGVNKPVPSSHSMYPYLFLTALLMMVVVSAGLLVRRLRRF
jgi:hypothetical protein